MSLRTDGNGLRVPSQWLEQWVNYRDVIIIKLGMSTRRKEPKRATNGQKWIWGCGAWGVGGQLQRTESPEQWVATETKVGRSLAASRPQEQLSHSIQHTHPCRVKGVRVNATHLYETWASGQVRRTERPLLKNLKMEGQEAAVLIQVQGFRPLGRWMGQWKKEIEGMSWIRKNKRSSVKEDL